MSGEGERAHRSRFDPLPEWIGPSTRLVHAARRPDYNAGAVVPPIYQTSTFHYPGPFSEASERSRAYLYTRIENPTQEVAAEPIRALEGAEGARVFGSGMGAIATTLLGLLRHGDEIVALADLYGGTVDLMSHLLPKYGVHVRWVHQDETAEPESCVRPGTRLAYIETPTNPTLRVLDIERWARAADAAGALLVIDNTFATPLNQTPIALGADLVVHSATKYLAGHSDVIAGAVAGSTRLLERIDAAHVALGATLDPFAAFLLARGLKTLALRMARQNENGRRLSAALRDHPAVRALHYPGFGSAEEEAIAARQMRGRGGIVSLSLAGGEHAARQFLQRLRLVHVASSLGGVESLVSVPAETSHRQLNAEELDARGIDRGLVRISLGIEDTDDLLRDITEALDGVAASVPATRD
ncbi:MAG: aminotransferase class I/II-fold pyridoxal phosphate-dependent enzyme [Thermoplasmata archaeon]|nr:aminotransferase class I/II-fold pyridoxal phosphate-dependent enzyme [Thermoplasmata archaeon]